MKNAWKLVFFFEILMKFCRNFTNIFRKCQNLRRIAENSEKIAKIWSKSRNRWDYSIVQMNYSVVSLVPIRFNPLYYYMHSIDWRRLRAHWRVHARRNQKEDPPKSCFCALWRFWLFAGPSRFIIFLAPAEGTAPKRGSVRQARAACFAISHSKKHDDISTLKMTGPRVEQILSKMPNLSNVEGKVGRIRSAAKKSARSNQNEESSK